MSAVFSDEIYKRDFPFAGPHLIAASAGTGKTYSMQNIYARLVAEKGLKPSEILVVTFTEAATNELRNRIRAVLNDFKIYLLSGASAVKEEERKRFEFLAKCAIENLSPDENDGKTKALDNITSALEQFDSAAISTIHGFCKRTLSKYSLETKSPFEFDISSGEEAEIIESLNDWWRANAKKIDKRIAQSGFSRNDGYSFLKEAVKKLASHKFCKLDFSEENNTFQDFLLGVAKELVEKYNNARSMRTSQTFQDLLSSLGEALENESGKLLARELRKDYKAALIDEFQDTDPLQYYIFKRIFLDIDEDEAKPPLFVVGDPKQAIYSFRGGDIFTYRAAATREDIKKATYRLDKNFRSTPRLIDAVNLLFRDAEEKPGATFGDETIDYIEDLKADDAKMGLMEDGKIDPRPMRFIETEKSDTMVAAAVQEIVNLLGRKEKDVQPKDIAVLCFSNHGTSVFKELAKLGISATYQKGESVFAQPIAKDFYHTLRAISEYSDIGKTKVALATGFFDIRFKELADASEEGELSRMRTRLSRLANVWQESGFEKMFYELTHLENCRIQERFSLSREKRRALEDLKKIYALSCEAISKIGKDPEAMVNWLAARIRLSGQGQPEEGKKEYLRPGEGDSNAVKILTHHVSKGLQFPVTIVITPTKSSSKDKLFAYHDHEGILHYTYQKNSAFEKEDKDEKMRLLYVALTRATKRCVLIYSKMKFFPIDKVRQNAKKRLEETSAEEPFLFTKFEESSIQAIASQKLNSEKGDINNIVARGIPKIGFSSSRPSYGSYSSLTPNSHSDSEGRDLDTKDSATLASEDESEIQEPIFSLPGGTKIGTCWHEILEKIPFDANEEYIQKLTDKTLLNYGFKLFDDKKNIDTSAIVADMINKTLKFELSSPNGDSFSLSQVKADKRLSEWEFYFSLSNAKESTLAIKQVLEKHWKDCRDKKPFIDAMKDWNMPIPEDYLKGYLDLVFSHNDFYYIVDWKSNLIERNKENFSREGILQEMENAGYYLQYLLYSSVLHQYLKETLQENYSWQNNFGGVKYIFLRGIACGAASPIFEDRPSEQLLDELALVLGLSTGGAE